nr:NADH dehydrogenase subunit 4L [Ruditapes philippinarum]
MECLFFFWFSIFMVFMEEKHFMNMLILFNMLMVSVFGFCVISGLVGDSVMVGYLSILILCMDVSSAVMGLSLLVNSSRFVGKSKVKSFSFLNF